MSIDLRIKQIRKACKITQQNLADRLGLKQNTIASYEIGKLSPSDRTIADICREFGVSEVWLRTGEGEMFLPVPEDAQMIEVLCRMQMDQEDAFVHTMTAAMKAYYNLPDSEKAAVKNLLKATLENLNKKSTPE